MSGSRFFINFIKFFKFQKKNSFIGIVFRIFIWLVIIFIIGFFLEALWDIVTSWSTRINIFIGIFFCFILIFYLLEWLVIKKGKRFILFLFSIVRSILHAIKNNPDVQKIILKYPLFFSNIKKRLDKNKFSGLFLTVLSLVFLYFAVNLIGIIFSIIKSGYISVDVSISNLLIAFRNPEITKIFLWVTLLGKWQVVFVFIVVATGILWLWQKRLYIVPFLFVIAGSEFFALIGKKIFHRPRPELAEYFEHSFSFPSGHATIAMAFYGFVTYVFIRELKKWRTKVNAFFLGLAFVLLIGFSRLYLGVHYVSDVWAGYLIGIMCLVVGIGITEWLYYKKKNLPPTFLQHKPFVSSVILIILALMFYLGFALKYQPLISQFSFIPNKITLKNVNDIFLNERLKWTETPRGNKQESVSFVIVAKNNIEFVNIFENAGWFLADEVSLTSMFKMAKVVWLKELYLNAPMTPSFWNSEVNNFGFEKSTESNNARQRHHARFWNTNFKTENGDNVYVGTASLDVGIKWGITHQISPDLDTEREYLFNDIKNTNTLESYAKQDFVKPILGQNFTGDQFFTDGKQYVIFIK